MRSPGGSYDDRDRRGRAMWDSDRDDRLPVAQLGSIFLAGVRTVTVTAARASGL